MLGAITIFLLYFHAKYGILRSLILGSIGLATLSALPSRLNEIDAGEESAAGRVDAWFEGIQMLIHKPIFGVGKGLFTDHNYLTAHNSFVLAFAELGLAGYFFWLSFVGLSVLMVYKISTTTADQLGGSHWVDVAEWNQCKDICRAYSYAMAGFFVCAFFLSRSYNILLFMLCALCVALYQVVRRQWPQFTPIAFRRFVGNILAFEFGSIAFIFVLVKVLLLLDK